MTTLTRDQALALANQAGFSGQSANIIVAIATAESGLRSDATNTYGNTPPSTDRGILQINSYWHPEVSDACAFDPACAFRQGFRISSGGTNFNAWSVYKGGQYKRYLGPTGSGAPKVQPSLPAIDIPNPLGGLAWLGNPTRVMKLLLGILLIGAAVAGVTLGAKGNLAQGALLLGEAA